MVREYREKPKRAVFDGRVNIPGIGLTPKQLKAVTPDPVALRSEPERQPLHEAPILGCITEE